MSHHDFDYPDSYVIINGHRMHYFHSGTEEERAVVMLHGNYSSSYGYRHFFPYLVGAGWRCLALDSIGFGGSDKPDDVDTHTFDFHSDNLEIFIREIGLRDVVLVGHEWGGLVALDYTINRMDNTRALVLMNSGAFLTNRPSRIRGLLHRSVLGDVLVRRLNLPLRDGSLKGKVYYKNNLDRQVKAHYRSPFPSYASRAGILGFLRMAPQGDNEYISKRIKTIQNNLPQLRVPTLLVGSKGDPVFGEAEAKVLRALIPNAELRVLDDGGHLLQEDRPDLLSSWIVDFLGRLAPV